MEGDALLSQPSVQFGHELERAELRVLVVSQHQDDVGPGPAGEVWLPVSLVHEVGLLGPASLLTGGHDGQSEEGEE